MGDMLSKIKEEDHCRELLERYVRCAEEHSSKFPDEYGVYCEEEKDEYLNCRRKTRENKENSN